MRRGLVIIAAFLLAGAVVNVAVAWASAAWSDVTTYSADMTWDPRDPFVPDRDAIWLLWRWRSPTAQRVYLRADDLDPWPAADAGPKEAFFPSWGATFLVTPPIVDDLDIRVVDGRGWPMLALWGGVRQATVLRAVPSSYAIPLSQLSFLTRLTEARFLPYRPIWPGFALNTLFYAAVFWLLIPGPFALRRFIRRRRGQCVKCGYPMGESSVCTECGGELAT